eukprot:tig00020537_g10242.t1
MKKTAFASAPAPHRRLLVRGVGALVVSDEDVSCCDAWGFSVQETESELRITFPKFVFETAPLSPLPLFNLFTRGSADDRWPAPRAAKFVRVSPEEGKIIVRLERETIKMNGVPVAGRKGAEAVRVELEHGSGEWRVRHATRGARFSKVDAGDAAVVSVEDPLALAPAAAIELRDHAVLWLKSRKARAPAPRPAPAPAPAPGPAASGAQPYRAVTARVHDHARLLGVGAQLERGDLGASGAGEIEDLHIEVEGRVHASDAATVDVTRSPRARVRSRVTGNAEVNIECANM